ncbi:MAG: hypothetical protein IKJ06_01530 [Clostridia bacterium]|nr:hypothetical protein [Clostridia bacterium]
MAKNKVPIYLICGFLESGKTTFIRETVLDPNFSDGEKTVILMCEDGEEEFDTAEMEKNNAVVIPVEEKNVLSATFLKNINKAHAPDRILIEYNGTWALQDLFSVKKPESWFLYQLIGLADANVFMSQINNMRSFMFDFISKAEMVVVNRCTPETDKVAIRKIVRGMNPSLQLLFENIDGTVDDGKDKEVLPYDLSGDEFQVDNEDFGDFYLDSTEQPDKYNGKTVTVEGIVMKSMQMQPGTFILGRPAMACCADDIGLAGFVCVYKSASVLPNKQWVKVTAKIEVAYSQMYQKQGTILHIINTEDGNEPEDKLVYFN